MAQERQRLYATAYSNISQRQKEHRLRFLELQRQRNPKHRYQFQPNDYVLVSGRKATGLAPSLHGPFRLVRITDGGNAIIQTDDAGTHRAQQQWSVRSERLVPYKYDYRCYDASQLQQDAASQSS